MAPRKGMTEREHIKWMIDLIEYRENSSHFNNFFRLENGLLEPVVYDLDLYQNLDLWDELRNTVKKTSYVTR